MEVFTMAHRSRQEYIRSIYPRYRQANRRQKTMILSEFVNICGYHRKHALRLLNGPLPTQRIRKILPPRPPIYLEPAIRTLAKIWTASGYLCSQRLQAALQSHFGRFAGSSSSRLLAYASGLLRTTYGDSNRGH